MFPINGDGLTYFHIKPLNFKIRIKQKIIDDCKSYSGSMFGDIQ